MDEKIEKDLLKLKNPKKAEILQRFFKTGKGEYGEGDIFLGITVPKQRLVAGKFKEASLNDLQKLLSSKIHEYRLTTLIILTLKYKKAEENEKKKIFDFYLKNTKNINNWDLVDLSAPNIVGEYLLNKKCHPEFNSGSYEIPKQVRNNKKYANHILYKLANSKNLWEKRIAIISTYAFIRKDMYEDALKISEMLLSDKHDLIHKAVGWMLREVGKRDLKTEEDFLKKYYKKMPRTMLRYAIEKFDENKRKFYLDKSPD